MDFNQKVMLITGAASGIGRAVAQGFARGGGMPVILDIDREGGRRLAEEIKGRGHKADFMHADISDVKSLGPLVLEIIGKYKKIDVLVNNAAICPIKNYEQVDLEQWNRVLDINLTGAFFLTREVAGYMKEKNCGKIVSMSSVSARMGGVNVGPHYAVSKGGIEAMTKYFAVNLAKYNINVNAVSMCTTDTGLIKGWDKKIINSIIEKIPLGRVASVEDAAGAVLFLSSEHANYITGEVLQVNGGLYMN
ncbi:MAG: SDR family NAD(P)-dependent oxidoreductase [Actinomycetota bacterium]